MQLLAPLVLLGLMYMFLIRPQQLRAKRQRQLIVSLEVGDRVLTVGGMVGTIVAFEGDNARIEIADGVVATFVRPAISRRADEPAAEAHGSDSQAGGASAPDAATPEVEA
jgi:preprotein translocase subunit YajC